MDFTDLTEEDNGQLSNVIKWVKNGSTVDTDIKLIVDACESFRMQLGLIEIIKVGTSEPEIDIPDYFENVTDIDQLLPLVETDDLYDINKTKVDVSFIETLTPMTSVKILFDMFHSNKYLYKVNLRPVKGIEDFLKSICYKKLYTLVDGKINTIENTSNSVNEYHGGRFTIFKINKLYMEYGGDENKLFVEVGGKKTCETPSNGPTGN